MIKFFTLSSVACVGAAVASIFGGWTGAMTTLVILMLIDYVTGLIVAYLNVGSAFPVGAVFSAFVAAVPVAV